MLNPAWCNSRVNKTRVTEIMNFFPMSSRTAKIITKFLPPQNLKLQSWTAVSWYFVKNNIFQSTYLGRFQLLYLLASDSLRIEPLLFSSTATGSVMGIHPSDGGPSCATRIIFTSRYLQHFQELIITVRNEVAKVMFLQVSVCPRGGGIPACLAAGLRGGGIPACPSPPASRRLLLRTVRILLECILVRVKTLQSPICSALLWMISFSQTHWYFCFDLQEKRSLPVGNQHWVSDPEIEHEAESAWKTWNNC